MQPARLFLKRASIKILFPQKKKKGSYTSESNIIYNINICAARKCEDKKIKVKEMEIRRNYELGK